MKIGRIAGGGLRITALEIRNLWGIAEAHIRPGQRNIIRGENGSGKTSLLEAAQLALGGGTLGKYQRLGSMEEPQIVLEISGSSDFIRIEREGDKPPKVLRRVGDSEAFEKVPAPATFLKGLFDVHGANPFAFLEASDDERAQLLLEALELDMEEGELAELLGDDAALAGDIPSSLHPLTRLALIHDRIYSARRGCNVDAEGKAKAAEQLKRSVPAERILDVGDKIALMDRTIATDAEQLARETEAHNAELKSSLAQAESQLTAFVQALTKDLRGDVADWRSTHERWAATQRAETERMIIEAERVLAGTVDKETARVNNSIAEHSSQIAAEVERDRTRREAQRQEEARTGQSLAESRETLAQLRERQAEAKRHEALREQIAAFEADAADIEKKSLRLSAKLKALEAFKRSLAEKLPIAGLEISGKEIKVNGVPWAQLNKAQQGGIAGVVAAERAKRCRLPVVFFDEAERFDEEHLNAIAQVVEAAGAQLFAAVVAREGEIVVEADGVPTGSVRIEAPADPMVSR